MGDQNPRYSCSRSFMQYNPHNMLLFLSVNNMTTLLDGATGPLKEKK